MPRNSEETVAILRYAWWCLWDFFPLHSCWAAMKVSDPPPTLLQAQAVAPDPITAACAQQQAEVRRVPIVAILQGRSMFA